MMYAGRTLLSVALVAVCAVAFPNHLKAKVDDSDVVVIPKVTSISASAGGFSAQAGIDRADGPFASAESPVGGASAGAGGAEASVGGAVAGTHPGTHQGPTVFDNIFNIPISVLHAVNNLLNNRDPAYRPGMANRRNGHHPAAPTPPDNVDKVDVGPAAESGVDTPAPAPAPAAGTHPHGPVVRKRVNFDDIFQIPIAALKSVNDLLNGRRPT